MLFDVGFNFVDLLTFQNLLYIVVTIGIIFVTLIVEYVLRRTLTSYSKRIGLSGHVENILRIFLRIIVAFAGISAILQYLGVGMDWLFSLSALAGAAIGFASTQTVGNFLAGLYLMITRPFEIEDYVKIGDIEGEVMNISINYTKIYNPTYNYIEISNRKVLDSNIKNYMSEDDLLDYSFEIGFPHSDKISNRLIIERCILPGIDEFYEEYRDLLPKKPEYGMSQMTRLERSFLIRIFFPKGKTKEFYDTQPLLMEEIVNLWDKLKTESI